MFLAGFKNLAGDVAPRSHPRRAARLAYGFTERQSESFIVRSVEQPAAIGPSFALDEKHGVAHALVGQRARVPEVVERAQHVVVVARREGEVQKLGGGA